MELELTDFHLPQAIENALVLVRERALRRGIALEQSIDPRLGEIRGDERKIKQVLLNLLSNAIKFTPDEGRINVQAVPRDTFVEVSVSDTGVGIAPEDQEAIFEEFRQVGTAAKKIEGTGLGLTLSRKFMTFMAGESGSRASSGRVRPSPSHFQCAMANEVILLVEDDSKKLVRDLLTFKGYEIIEAETGE
jgi:signal transduction histidine kinase